MVSVSAIDFPLIFPKLPRILYRQVRVLEAGANIGATTIPLALHLPPEGRVLALEASQVNLWLLNANVALAQLSNVDTFQGALGLELVESGSTLKKTDASNPERILNVKWSEFRIVSFLPVIDE